MDIISAVKIIKHKFEECGREAKIPFLKGDHFNAKLVEGGIEVDNLGNYPFLPWEVFQEAICILIRNNGRAFRGNAHTAKFGDPKLGADTIEGHIAQVVYGKRGGESVFRRITPISCILIWASLCEPGRGELILK